MLTTSLLDDMTDAAFVDQPHEGLTSVVVSPVGEKSVGGVQNDLTDREDEGYPDLLLHRSFLLPYVSLCLTILAGFGLVRGMCDASIPDNCNLTGSNQIVQQLIACLERGFLVCAVGNMAFLFPAGWHTQTRSIVRTVLLHLFAIASCAAVAGALNDASIRSGMNGKRLAVAVLLAIFLLVPLLYTLGWHNTPRQRFKSLAVFLVYLAFLIATAGIGGLHIHHWSWSFILLVVWQTPLRVKETHEDSACHRAMVWWCHGASMFAVGVMVQGFAAYSSLYFFISKSKPFG
jgi:hypothetical protein